MNRALTERERLLLTSTLELMRTGKHDAFGPIDNPEVEAGLVRSPKPQDPTPFLEQIDSLRVVRECPCGQRDCETVEFAMDARQGEVADVIASRELASGQLILVFARGEELTELEVIGS